MNENLQFANQHSIATKPTKQAITEQEITEQEIQEENRRARRLQFLVGLVMNTIGTSNMPVEEASELVASTKRAALALFPDKEFAYDLIYKPRLQRLMVEKYRLV